MDERLWILVNYYNTEVARIGVGQNKNLVQRNRQMRKNHEVSHIRRAISVKERRENNKRRNHRVRKPAI